MIKSCGFIMLCGINSRFQLVSPTQRQIAHVLLTRPPLARGASTFRSFDLHVLSVPPAFVLSQDQTLNENCILRLLKVLWPFLALLFQFAVVHHFSVFCLTSSTSITQSFSKGFVSFIVQFSRYWCTALSGECLYIISRTYPFVNRFSELLIIRHIEQFDFD